jgi:hypothetical protein
MPLLYIKLILFAVSRISWHSSRAFSHYHRNGFKEIWNFYKNSTRIHLKPDITQIVTSKVSRKLFTFNTIPSYQRFAKHVLAFVTATLGPAQPNHLHWVAPFVHRAQGTGHRAQRTGHGAQGTGHRAQRTPWFSNAVITQFSKLVSSLVTTCYLPFSLDA